MKGGGFRVLFASFRGSEHDLFELAKLGYLGAAEGAPKSLLGRFLGISMRRGPGTCGDAVAHIESLGQVM